MSPVDVGVAALALLGVVGLILLARRGLQSLPMLTGLQGAANRTGPLQVEQTLALDPRRRLLLVRCGARRLLLLTGGSRDLMLGWLDAPADDPRESP